jgi:hypothetical protein
VDTGGTFHPQSRDTLPWGTLDMFPLAE